MKFLYLHGLGQKPDSWDRVIKETKVSDSSVCLSLAEMLEDKAATYGELYAAFSEECNKENDEIVLCGLSLGAVLALHYAIDHPNKVKALVLIAAQYKMPEKLLKFQNMLFRFMAEFVMKDLVEKAGISAQFEIASAATSTEEIGNPVYPPARSKLAGRGACQHRQNAVGWTLL